MQPNRQFCTTCWQPEFNCFCSLVEKFDPKIEFVILIHPLESRRRVATGRMSYLSLSNSYISRGSNFAQCPIVNRLLKDSTRENVLLARGPDAVDLTTMDQRERSERFTINKKLRIFVVDGTWTNANKMLRHSPNLTRLPKFCFTPPTPSNIRVRKQPSSSCFSTLEAIHHIIELLGPSVGFDVDSRQHDQLFKPFTWMVEKKIERLKLHHQWNESTQAPCYSDLK